MKTKKILYFLSSIISVFIIAFMVLISSVKHNPLNHKLNIKYLSVFVPQGWSFFTKETNQHTFTIYECFENNFRELNFKNSQRKYYFGMDKSNRVLPNIIESKLNNFNNNLWYNTKSDIKTELIDSLNTVSIDLNHKYHSKYKGLYIIKIENVKPWFYFSKNIEYKHEYFYIKILLK